MADKSGYSVPWVGVILAAAGIGLLIARLVTGAITVLGGLGAIAQIVLGGVLVWQSYSKQRRARK